MSWENYWVKNKINCKLVNLLVSRLLKVQGIQKRIPGFSTAIFWVMLKMIKQFRCQIEGKRKKSFFHTLIKFIK